MPPLLYRQKFVDIVCSMTGKSYRIFVAWPENVVPTDLWQTKMVYLLDANAYFRMAVETVMHSRLYGIIIGVGYPEPGPLSPRRNEDLTPPSSSYTPPIPLPETLHGGYSAFPGVHTDTSCICRR